jgi:hypothetical protein
VQAGAADCAPRGVPFSGTPVWIPYPSFEVQYAAHGGQWSDMRHTAANSLSGGPGSPTGLGVCSLQDFGRDITRFLRTNSIRVLRLPRSPTTRQQLNGADRPAIAILDKLNTERSVPIHIGDRD